MACEGALHCSSLNPFTTFTTCSAPFPATPLPVILPHIYLLSSTQNKGDWLLRTNWAYRTTCRFRVAKSYQDFSTGLHKYFAEQGSKLSVSGTGLIETRRSYVVVRRGGQLDSMRCLYEDVIVLVLHRKSSLLIQAK